MSTTSSVAETVNNGTRPSFDLATHDRASRCKLYISHTLHTIEDYVIKPTIQLRPYISQNNRYSFYSWSSWHTFFLLYDTITNPFSVLHPHQPLTNKALIYSRLLSVGLPAERFLLGAGLVPISTLAPVDAREAEDGELGRGRKRDCRPAIGSSFKPY